MTLDITDKAKILGAIVTAAVGGNVKELQRLVRLLSEDKPKDKPDEPGEGEEPEEEEEEPEEPGDEPGEGDERDEGEESEDTPEDDDEGEEGEDEDKPIYDPPEDTPEDEDHPTSRDGDEPGEEEEEEEEPFKPEVKPEPEPEPEPEDDDDEPEYSKYPDEPGKDGVIGCHAADIYPLHEDDIDRLDDLADEIRRDHSDIDNAVSMLAEDIASSWDRLAAPKSVKRIGAETGSLATGSLVRVATGHPFPFVGSVNSQVFPTLEVSVMIDRSGSMDFNQSVTTSDGVVVFDGNRWQASCLTVAAMHEAVR